MLSLFSNPYDQVREQLRITIEGVKERQENASLVHPLLRLLLIPPTKTRLASLLRIGHVIEQPVARTKNHENSCGQDALLILCV
jgi:hypothetical protein